MIQFPHISKFHFFSVDEETNEAWDSTCNSFDNYEELKENIYSKDLEQLALNSIQVCLFVAIQHYSFSNRGNIHVCSSSAK